MLQLCPSIVVVRTALPRVVPHTNPNYVILVPRKKLEGGPDDYDLEIAT